MGEWVADVDIDFVSRQARVQVARSLDADLVEYVTSSGLLMRVEQSTTLIEREDSGWLLPQEAWEAIVGKLHSEFEAAKAADCDHRVTSWVFNQASLGDDELDMLGIICQAIDRIPEDARYRAIEWVSRRYRGLP